MSDTTRTNRGTAGSIHGLRAAPTIGRVIRRMLLWVCAAACLQLGVAASAIASAFVYRVSSAHFDTYETGKYTSDSPVAWNGEGHRHDVLAADDPETPSLPIVLRSGGGGLSVVTDVEFHGNETLISNDGSRDSCSGPWSRKETGGFSVVVKPRRGGKLATTWTVPHGLASYTCGFNYDLIRGDLKVTSHSDGSIGEARIVLKTKDTKSLTESESHGTVRQEVAWDGEIVLKRVKRV